MTTDEIVKSLQQMIKDYGAASDIKGLADEEIGYGNYKQILARYKVMVHNMMRMSEEQAKRLVELEKEVAALKPGEGPKTGRFA